MSDDNESTEYDSDTRTPCRYGLNCYQKNAAHHEKFKHPPKKREETVEEESKANADSSIKNEKEKHKKKNLLTDWLKSPPNKKAKVDGSSKDKNVKPGTSLNSSKDKIFNSPGSESKNNKNNKNTKQNVEAKKTIEIIHYTFEEDERNEKSEGTKNEKDNDDDNKRNESATSISIVPLQMDFKSKIKKFFLVDMPNDFYNFWSFCESMGSLLLAKGNPLDAFKSVGLTLVGPFDVLANKFNDNIVYDPSALLRHYRYYYDVPEFQTVIKGDEKTGFHIGYFRDDPKENPVFVASNCAEENGIIKPVAENLFGAVNIYLEDYKKTADPFAKLKIVKLQNSLTTWANKNDITLSKSTVAMKRREAAVVTRTFHKAGLVVSYDKKTELGYRELAESDATIKGILRNIVDSKSDEERKQHFSKLYPIINYANIANDECDFGTSLELGLDLFTFGSPLLHETVKRLMVTSYKLLGRDEFADIIEAHLQDRQKGSNLSILKKN